jgi:hypothetical protein
MKGPIRLPHEGVLQPISAEERSKIERAVKDMEEKQRVLERHQMEPVDINVDVHKGCGGTIMYASSFRVSCSSGEIRFGGDNPTEESVKCRCLKCGQLYDPDFLPYRTQVVEYRNRS